MPKWYKAKIERILDRTKTTKSFFFSLPEFDNFEFQPGQFITLDLPISDKRIDRWRSYSIANPPNGSNQMELVIVKVPFGKATNYLFNEVKEGTELNFKGPSGVFCLPKNLEKDFVFICTGTGVAPFRSMLHYIQDQKIHHQKIHLIFGTRTKSNILYLDEWEAMKDINPKFYYDIALSRETYNGYQGYVHDIYLKQYKELENNRLFYLCGWQKMVDQAKENLLGLGYDKSQIVEELYG